MTKHPVLIAGVLLGAFAVLGTGLVALTYKQTADQIAANERQSLLRKLNAMVPADTVDNDMTADVLIVSDPDLLGDAQTKVYRGRLKGAPVAAVIASIVPDGYSGPIKLLVAVKRDNTLAGVRIISHKETPGLGDKIEEERSDWIYSFDGKSIGNPPLEKWKVKRDGGVFDHFTGATITPRSIVQAVKKTLIYAKAQGDALYAPAGPAKAAAVKAEAGDS